MKFKSPVPLPMFSMFLIAFSLRISPSNVQSLSIKSNFEPVGQNLLDSNSPEIFKTQRLDQGEEKREILDENNKKVEPCEDRVPNCPSIANIVTCCNMINAQSGNSYGQNMLCRKSCGICGGGGVFGTTKPPNGNNSPAPASTSGGQTQTQTSGGQHQTQTSGGQPTPTSLSTINDRFCRPDNSVPIVEPQPPRDLGQGQGQGSRRKRQSVNQ